MKAQNIFVNGESLDTILRHYNNINILIHYLLESKDSKALREWDHARSEPIEKDIVLEIK